MKKLFLLSAFFLCLTLGWGQNDILKSRFLLDASSGTDQYTALSHYTADSTYAVLGQYGNARKIRENAPLFIELYPLNYALKFINDNGTYTTDWCGPFPSRDSSCIISFWCKLNLSLMTFQQQECQFIPLISASNTRSLFYDKTTNELKYKFIVSTSYSDTLEGSYTMDANWHKISLIYEHNTINATRRIRLQVDSSNINIVDYQTSSSNFHIEPKDMWNDNEYMGGGSYYSYGPTIARGSSFDDLRVYKIVGMYDGDGDPLATSIKQQTDIQTQLYPNPAQDNLTLEVADYYRTARIDVFDIFGRNVLSQLAEVHLTQLDVSHLRPGLYTLRFSTGSNSKCKTFIKK